MKNILIISLILISFHEAVTSKIIFPRDEPINIGDMCEDYNSKGTIQRFINCQLAQKNLKDANIYPRIYAFDAYEPIICCIGEIGKNTGIRNNLEYQNIFDNSTFTIEANTKVDSKPITCDNSAPSYFELDEIKCTTEGKVGILSQFRDCSTAISKFKNESIRPEIFMFKGLEPIICCIK